MQKIYIYSIYFRCRVSALPNTDKHAFNIVNGLAENIYSDKYLFRVYFTYIDRPSSCGETGVFLKLRYNPINLAPFTHLKTSPSRTQLENHSERGDLHQAAVFAICRDLHL